MDLQLNGKTAVVTGASRGIGLAITQALVREGARVVAGARTTSAELDSLVAGGDVQFVAVDLGRPEAAATLVDAAAGRIDVLVNNVGHAPARTEGFLAITDEQWQQSLDLNLLSAVRILRSAVPVMIAGGGGSVVTVVSVNAVLPDPAVLDYGAAKAALANASKALSKELAPSRIRLNTVSPGPVSTALWLGAGGVAETFAAAGGATAQEVVDQAARQSPTGRFTTPDEVADLVLLLASERSANVTGADFTVDGGLVPTW
ncbi:SDR family oxidoreductase [Angustibacter luteus]|uniref:SDR family oxidoreductase n=1 Tax=Angustibacter luteus TaxID=658456 RepID=A0ABW1JD72_9ACTN